MEIGVYSGGSLQMWKQYFGDKCHIHGVDVEKACQVYEEDRITIHVGDQADRDFWRAFRAKVPKVDVLIDDGGHHPAQQRVTLEEMLQHLSPGGVYICEDIHGTSNPFSTLVHGLADQLNAFVRAPHTPDTTQATSLQADLHSFHFYPYVVVIEKNVTQVEFLSAPKQGTEWQPFL